MKTVNFPYLALPFGLVFMLAIMIGSETGSNGVTRIPLLTLLVMNEFAFIITAAGGYIGMKHMLSVGVRPVYATITIGCILLVIRFLLLGIALWPESF